MTIAARPMTLEEYLNYDDGTDTRYELVDGVLTAMPAESTLNTQIAVFLLLFFTRFGIPADRLGIKQQIAVSSNPATARDPDLIVHSEASALALLGLKQALITLDMPAPLLVVEVVSPNAKNHQRDYVTKRREYAARQIPEYWIIDPDQLRLTVCGLVDGQYAATEFRGNDLIASALFPNLNLTAHQLLQAEQKMVIDSHEKNS